jgi:hypothetical protein
MASLTVGRRRGEHQQARFWMMGLVLRPIVVAQPAKARITCVKGLLIGLLFFSAAGRWANSLHHRLKIAGHCRSSKRHGSRLSPASQHRLGAEPRFASRRPSSPYLFQHRSLGIHCTTCGLKSQQQIRSRTRVSQAKVRRPRARSPANLLVHLTRVTVSGGGSSVITLSILLF